MSATEGNTRPVRKRTAVPTYNLKVLNGTSKHTRTSYRRKHLRLGKQSMTPTQANNSTLRIPKLSQPTERCTSSPLTSPMASPRIDALANSLQDIAAAPLETSMTYGPSQSHPADGTTDDMPSQGSAYDCFNSHNNPRGHYYSTRELYSRGVWVGYL